MGCILELYKTFHGRQGDGEHLEKWFSNNSYFKGSSVLIRYPVSTAKLNDKYSDRKYLILQRFSFSLFKN